MNENLLVIELYFGKLVFLIPFIRKMFLG